VLELGANLLSTSCVRRNDTLTQTFVRCFFVDATQYVYVSEIWPNQLRSQGTALGLAAFYLASEVTLVAAPVALNDIGWR